MLSLAQANIVARARRRAHLYFAKAAVRAALIARQAGVVAAENSREVACHVLGRELNRVSSRPSLTWRVYGTIGGNRQDTLHLVDKKSDKVYRTNGLGDLLAAMADIPSAVDHVPITDLDILIFKARTEMEEHFEEVALSYCGKAAFNVSVTDLDILLADVVARELEVTVL